MILKEVDQIAGKIVLLLKERKPQYYTSCHFSAQPANMLKQHLFTIVVLIENLTTLPLKGMTGD